MWKKVNSRKIFSHPRIELTEDEILLPSGSIVSYLKFEQMHDSVTVICIRKGKEILLQREYSYPPDALLYQFPGGKIESGESAEDGARRELKEESGYKARNLSLLGWYYIDNRRSAAKMYVFLVANPVPCEKEGGDQEEEIVNEWATIESLEHQIAQGEIVSFSLLSAWTLFRVRPLRF
jgi:8-oxo-dGTP pyrophosphatase MutT (NUDIX family)